jgi:hypothetical protein
MRALKLQIYLPDIVGAKSIAAVWTFALPCFQTAVNTFLAKDVHTAQDHM